MSPGLHIEKSGEGQYLVLIHGMGSASTAWRPIRSTLNKDFSVITLDLPGHGQTPYQKGELMDPNSLAVKVLDQLSNQSIESFHLAGNSLGGWIALELAAMAPERVKSLVGIAPAGLWLHPFNARYPFAALNTLVARSLSSLAPTALHFTPIRRLGFSDVSPKWQDFSYELCLDAAIAMAKAKGYYPAWDGMLLKRFDRHIPKSIPTTIIFGDSDETLPEISCQEKSLAPKHARWIIFPETGHVPMWDSPLDVIDEIKKVGGISK